MTRRRATQTLFRSINAVVEPAVRAGLANPVGPAAGIVVVETIGRRSGSLRRTPLLGVRSCDGLIVTTVRGDSDWVKNLEHQPAARAWLHGRPIAVRADVTRTALATVVRLRPEADRRADRSAATPAA